MIQGDDGHDDHIVTMIIMVFMSSMAIMVMISVKGWREHPRNHYGGWKQSCTDFENWLCGPLAPGFNIGRAPGPRTLRCEWKESCTTRRDLNIDVGGPRGSHGQIALPARFWRWCRIVSIDRLEFYGVRIVSGPFNEFLTSSGVCVCSG